MLISHDPDHMAQHMLAWAQFAPNTDRPKERVLRDIPERLDLKSGTVLRWVGTARKTGIADAGLLSQYELTRMGRFRQDRDARGYVAAHGALRLILAAVLGTSPQEISYVNGPHGKPSLVRGDVSFNISHTGDMAVVAVSRTPIGVDIEAVRPADDLLGMARERFPKEHIVALENCPAEALPAQFFRFWTLSEALVKALGRGLTQPLDGFAFSSTGAPKLLRAAAEVGDPGDWHFRLSGQDHDL